MDVNSDPVCHVAGCELQHGPGAGCEVWEDAHHPGSGRGGACAVPTTEGRPRVTRSGSIER